MLSCGNEPCDVRHIHHKDRADFLCDCTNALKVDDARIRRRTCNNHLRLVLLREHLQRIVVNALRLLVHAIGDDLVIHPRDVDGAAVCQMSAIRQIHAEDRVARLKESKEHRHIRLCARVRLHIRPVCSEELLRAVDRELFRHIDVFTAAVVTLTGIPLRVLVRENTALRLLGSRESPA